MAARVLLGRRVAAPFMAATLAGGALIPSVAFAEAPEDLSKKPIYDDFEIPIPKTAGPTPSPFSDTIPRASSPESPSAEIKPAEPSSSSPLVSSRGPTPTDRLAVQIGRARLFLYEHATRAEDAVNRGMDQAFHLEKSFTQTVASLAPARESGEQLMPGLVYVLVAGMAGSIVSRNRNILLRASAPLALGIGAGWLVLPVTMNNVSGLLWKYEQKFPVVADAHIRSRENIFKSLEMAKVHSQASRQYVEDKVTGVRDAVEDWVKKGK
ncbi:apolipo protein O-domain-containing protein [Pestalotiopsis sp. NC0098]|nr:apolipo protein O-domain-containing protein [Pestalotiopsis sp. NC0098]